MVPQGMGFECSAIRQIRKVNRSGDRHRLESDRVVQPLRIKAATFISIRDAEPERPLAPVRSGPAPKGVAIDTSGIRQFVIPLTAAVAAASEGVESLRTISCGQVG